MSDYKNGHMTTSMRDDISSTLKWWIEHANQMEEERNKLKHELSELEHDIKDLKYEYNKLYEMHIDNGELS